MVQDEDRRRGKGAFFSNCTSRSATTGRGGCWSSLLEEQRGCQTCIVQVCRVCVCVCPCRDFDRTRHPDVRHAGYIPREPLPATDKGPQGFQHPQPRCFFVCFQMGNPKPEKGPTELLRVALRPDRDIVHPS